MRAQQLSLADIQNNKVLTEPISHPQVHSSSHHLAHLPKHASFEVASKANKN